MEADVSGHQRKVMRSSIKPARSMYGTEGIPVRDGKTLPFLVTRGWNAPEGYYAEAFYLVGPDTGEVFYEGPTEMRLIWGLQSITDITTEVVEPVELPPGTYRVVFALGAMKGGEREIEVFDVETKAA